MILLSAQNIQKSFGTNVVLKDASLVLQDGQRLGLVGVNGCGKSTLMKIIAGLEPYDGGTLTMQKGLRLGYLAQQGMVTPGKTVLEELEAVFEPVVAMEARLRQLEQDMAHTAEDPVRLRQLGNQYDQLTRQFEESNGYGWRSTACWRASASAGSSRTNWRSCSPAGSAPGCVWAGCCFSARTCCCWTSPPTIWT